MTLSSFASAKLRCASDFACYQATGNTENAAPGTWYHVYVKTVYASDDACKVVCNNNLTTEVDWANI